MRGNPQRWLRWCPVHDCLRTECSTKHYGEVYNKIEFPENFNLNFKEAMGRLIQAQSTRSITSIQLALGWKHQNLDSIFRFGNQSMAIKSAYKICLAAGIDIAEVFKLTEMYCKNDKDE